MRVWIELSGEHPTLPRAEALAALEAERVKVGDIGWSSKVLRVEATGPVLRAVARLGLSHFVCEELARGDLDDLRSFARDYELGGASFRTRARSLGAGVDVSAVEGSLGAEFGRTGRVDLVHPSVDFRVLVGNEFLLGRVVHRVDRRGFEARKAEHRPFNLPISLHPKLARALVNLSRVPSGGLILDPFCGTGGILLEGARIGLRCVGGDVKRTMLVGARRSLRALGGEAGLVVADAGHGPWRSRSLDGIATDPPYGRASSTKGEPPLRLYERAFASFGESLPGGRYVAAVLPSEQAIAAAEASLDLVERHALRVHGSLTRNFCVFVT